MPSNIEIKARAADWDGQIALARALADKTEELIQEDIFFNTCADAVTRHGAPQAAECPEGRLKLRIIEGGESYLIFYRRFNQKGPKSSVYYPSPVRDPQSMKTLLGAALGRGKTVKKKRLLFLSGQTRIHFDEVEGLGRFIELEVCMKDGQAFEEGEALAKDFMRRLAIGETDLLEGAYADMLNH
ncbi:MAG: hypothetical protein A2270_01035 [Elusimicrobia bacterium RIFOXYA12_FULL_51_18]|nr:MAG: hypothetical protein A2270_01035 [Elusimicrobia bacterium RIFOXYA12_FULL_51_18]OGS31111.1 MAG: hypothetical protein A2218_02100 [Elusimicrobia bacterium RIFOXYA2_FULL_53_38]